MKLLKVFLVLVLSISFSQISSISAVTHEQQYPVSYMLSKNDIYVYDICTFGEIKEAEYIIVDNKEYEFYCCERVQEGIDLFQVVYIAID